MVTTKENEQTSAPTVQVNESDATGHTDATVFETETVWRKGTSLHHFVGWENFSLHWGIYERLDDA